MSYRKVRVGCKYRLETVFIDYEYRHHDGEIVRVVNKPGCPPANTMGHCYVVTMTGEFIGLVCTNSLVPLRVTTATAKGDPTPCPQQ